MVPSEAPVEVACLEVVDLAVVEEVIAVVEAEDLVTVEEVVQEDEEHQEVEEVQAVEELEVASVLEPRSWSNPMKDSRVSMSLEAKTMLLLPRTSLPVNLSTMKRELALRRKKPVQKLSIESGTHSDPRLLPLSLVVLATST